MPYHATDPETAKLAGDVNHDGKVNVEDAQFILEYYVRSLANYKSLSWEDILKLSEKE